MHKPLPTDSSGVEHPEPPRIVLLLIALTSVGPMALNILMPAVPVIGQVFATDAGTAQLTLSLFLLGLAVSQLVLGPLSDRFGRRPVMIGGLALTIAASFAALAAASISWLIVARTIQALGASTGMVLGRAIIRDLYERERAASMIGWVTMVMVIAPIVAPSIGGVLDTAIGWQAIFAFVGLFCTALLVWVLLALPETRALAYAGGGLARFAEETVALASDPRFAGYVLVTAFGSAVFFAFLGGAPHVVITLMNRSSAEYGLWFALGGLGYMAGNFAAARWSMRFGSDAMIRIGALVAVVGTLVALACVIVFPMSVGPAIIFLPQLLLAFANGLLLPNGIAGAISLRPAAAGAASGITGFTQMSVGAAAAQYVGYLLHGSDTAVSMALVMLGCALVSLISFVVLLRR